VRTVARCTYHRRSGIGQALTRSRQPQNVLPHASRSRRQSVQPRLKTCPNTVRRNRPQQPNPKCHTRMGVSSGQAPGCEVCIRIGYFAIAPPPTLASTRVAFGKPEGENASEYCIVPRCDTVRWQSRKGTRRTVSLVSPDEIDARKPAAAAVISVTRM
jgi:hypothetical protein